MPWKQGLACSLQVPWKDLSAGQAGCPSVRLGFFTFLLLPLMLSSLRLAVRIPALAHVHLQVTYFEKTLVKTSLRQRSRHCRGGLHFAAIVVEHGKGRPHRRIGCCIESNPIVLFSTNKPGNNLITAAVIITTARTPSLKIDVPDLRDFQFLFSCHSILQSRASRLDRLSTQADRTYEVRFCSLRLSRNRHLISMPHFRNRPW